MGGVTNRERMMKNVIENINSDINKPLMFAICDQLAAKHGGKNKFDCYMMAELLNIDTPSEDLRALDDWHAEWMQANRAVDNEAYA